MPDHAVAIFVAGVIVSMRVFLSFVKARKSHSSRIPCQKVSLRPRNAPKRIDMVGVMQHVLTGIVMKHVLTGIALGAMYCGYAWWSVKEEAPASSFSPAHERLLAIENPAELKLEISKLRLPGEFVHQMNGGVVLFELAKNWFKRDTRYALEMISEIPGSESRHYALQAGRHRFVSEPEEFLEFADAKLNSTYYRNIRTDIFVALG